MHENKLEILNMSVNVVVNMAEKGIIPKYFIEYLNAVYPFSNNCIQPKTGITARKIGNVNYLHLTFTSEVCPTLRSFEEYMLDYIFGDFFKIISVCGWKVHSYDFEVNFNRDFSLYDQNISDVSQDVVGYEEITILSSPDIGCTGYLLHLLYASESIPIIDEVVDEFEDFGKYRLKNIPSNKLEETKQLIKLFGLNYE